MRLDATTARGPLYADARTWTAGCATPWPGPPRDVLGGVVPIEQVLFRNQELVIALASAAAFPQGVELRLRLAARHPEGGDEDVWWDRRELLFGGPHRHRVRPGKPLADELLRFGVRFPGGAKATTVDRHPGENPHGPVLRDSGEGGGGGGDRFVASRRNLWLWPLPPPEPFEFVIEWPAFDVPLTFVTVDGEPIAMAARRAQPYWP